MADDLSQEEADHLVAMRKVRMDESVYLYPSEENLDIDLVSEDSTTPFRLTICRAGVYISKGSYQNLARNDVILRRLCYGRKSHRNPDDREIRGTHLHYHVPGFADRWAMELPDGFPTVDGCFEMLEAFMAHCTIVRPPIFDRSTLPS